MVVASHMAMARPWLVAWALSPLIDAPTNAMQEAARAKLSSLMRFRANHFNLLYDFGAAHGPLSKHARVGVLRPWQHSNFTETNVGVGGSPLTTATTSYHSPPEVLRTFGVAYRVETAHTILQYQSLTPVDGGSAVELLLCDATFVLSAAAAEQIAVWVRRGGALVSTHNCGVMQGTCLV
jgi:hypothetical protein